MTTIGQTSPLSEKSENSLGPPPGAKKAFTGGEQGFVPLTLKEVEDINHNTKKFIFALPEGDMVSGLAVACEFFPVLLPYWFFLAHVVKMMMLT